MALKISVKSQQLLSAILFLLYLFIAMPVQYWHNCENHAYHQANQKQSGANTSLDKSGGISHDCTICSHQYTVYSSEVTTIQITCISNYSNCLASPTFFYRQHVACGLSNKSPPIV